MNKFQRIEEASLWIAPFTRWSCQWALHGPTWLPRLVRRVPLKIALLVMRHVAIALR